MSSFEPRRIGQTKVVQVYRIVCQDSVEEQALTRLRKKLYLSYVAILSPSPRRRLKTHRLRLSLPPSAKVMGTMHNATSVRPADDDASTGDQKAEDDAPRMTRGELASILRGGASALAKWGSEGKDAFVEFRDSSFADLREKGRMRDEKKEVGIKIEAGENVDAEKRKQLELEEEEAEKLLLAGKEAVQARYVF